MKMENCSSGNSELEGEEKLIAAAEQIARVLGSKKKLTDETRRILAELGSQLSSVTSHKEREVERLREIEKCLDSVQEKIMSKEGDDSMIWDLGPDEAFEYMNAANEAQKLADRLQGICLNGDDDDDGGGGEKQELERRAHAVLQMAMDRLEEEFRYMFVQNRQPFEPELVSFRSSEEETIDESSIISYGDDSVEESINRDSISRISEDFIIDLVHPDVIPELRCIAKLMFNSKYDLECIQAYTSVRQDALDECLYILEIEKQGIDDVLRLEWANLNNKIRKWIRTMKIFVRVYLASEKWLCDQILGEHGAVSLACFVDSTKASLLQLLNFGEAMSVGPHQPEKLFRILDMYEVMADLLPDIEALYMGDAGSAITMEFHEVLNRLGDCVKATFLDFKHVVASNLSSNPFSKGGVHPLTRYVMNFIKTLTDYSQTLNFLLKNRDDGNNVAYLSSPDTSPSKEDKEDKSRASTIGVSLMARHCLTLADVLEENLVARSKLYKETALQHLFLMNNIHYMAQKVKGCELRPIFGDYWIRKHNGKFQQHAMDYERATWGSILPLFKDDGIQNSGSSSLSKTILKERFKSFYLAFEEIYRTQTAWVIPDVELREDMRISASLKVVQAYRTFAGRYGDKISDRFIKYSADDLENFILDLFEGTPKILHCPSRR